MHASAHLTANQPSRRHPVPGPTRSLFSLTRCDRHTREVAVARWAFTRLRNTQGRPEGTVQTCAGTLFCGGLGGDVCKQAGVRLVCRGGRCIGQRTGEGRRAHANERRTFTTENVQTRGRIARGGKPQQIRQASLFLLHGLVHCLIRATREADKQAWGVLAQLGDAVGKALPLGTARPGLVRASFFFTARKGKVQDDFYVPVVH